MASRIPTHYTSRPVAILGAGVLGCRIACTWAAAGYHVHVRDPSPQQRDQCLQYVEESLSTYQAMTGSKELGKVKVFEEIEPAVSEAWLVIEAVPEQLDLKISIFALLEKSAPHDALLASNSSSYKSSEIVVQVSDSGKERAFNMHYYRPPENMIVELMTDGVTRPEILTFMSERLKKTGALPFVARKESTGFIFNRLWAAVKREVLMIISEGIGSPQEIDSYWNEAFIKPKVGPCKAMDEAGLDTIAFIESHYIAERGLETSHLDFLKAEYLEKGKLGDKSAAGGLCTT